jgi:glycosyltransferase involved in cell wall biosynthesis
MKHESQRKLRIVFLTHGARNVGGGERFLSYLIKRLDRTRFEPTILYSTKNIVIEDLEAAGVKLTQFPLSEQLTSIYRNQVSIGKTIRLASDITAAVWRLTKYLKKNKIDILYAHDNLSKLIGVPAAKMTGTKIVTTCHDQLGSNAIDRLLLRYQHHFMNKVFCVSDHVGKSFSKLGKSKAVVIHNGIDIGFWKISDDLIDGSETVTLGIVAVFDQVKGHDILFQAIALLRDEGVADFKCLVIGDGRERESIEGLVQKLGIVSYVEFKGYQNNVREFMGQINILVVTSRQESFGMVAVEAMAMNIPVVAAKVGGLPEVVENEKTGLLFETGNVIQLASALRDLIANPQRRKKMGVAGRERAEKMFDIERSIKTYQKELLETVL